MTVRRRIAPEALLLAGLAVLLLGAYLVTRDGAIVSLVSGALGALYALLQITRRRGNGGKPGA